MSQQTSLSGAIDDNDNGLTVASETGFPATVPFTILIGSELLRVTAVAGTSWNVTRGYDSTTAAAHSDGSTITLVPDAYAGLSDILATMALDGTARYDLLLDMAADVSADIDAATMRSFFVPTADVTVYVDVVRWSDSLVTASDGFRTTDGRALDIVSVTSLAVRDGETSSYQTIAAGDTGYYLEPGPSGTGVAGTDWPWEDITLSPSGADFAIWPRGKRAVRIVGKVGGFPVIPASVKRATVSEVRERFRQSIGGGQAPAGVNQFGTPIFLTGDSPDMRRVLRTPFSRRPMAA